MAKSRYRIAVEKVERASEEVDAIARIFAAVDAIDAVCGPKYPNRGVCTCPNCGGRLTYVNLTHIKGAARCSTAGCVDFASSH